MAIRVRWSSAVRVQSDAPGTWWGYPATATVIRRSPAKLNGQPERADHRIAHRRRRAGYRMIHDLLRPQYQHQSQAGLPAIP